MADFLHVFKEQYVFPLLILITPAILRPNVGKIGDTVCEVSVGTYEDRRRIGRGQWRARERLHLADHHLGSGI